MSVDRVDFSVGLTPIGISMSGRWWTVSAGWSGLSLSPPTNRDIGGWSPGSSPRDGWFGSGWKARVVTERVWPGICPGRVSRWWR